jgi:hypothetical protein
VPSGEAEAGTGGSGSPGVFFAAVTVSGSVTG